MTGEHRGSACENPQEFQTLVSDIWTYSSLDVHLYSMVCAIENPLCDLANLTDEGDWRFHTDAWLQDSTLEELTNNAPLRSLIIACALERLASDEDYDLSPADPLAVLASSIRMQCLSPAVEMLPNLSSTGADPEVLRLLLHLASESELEPFLQTEELDLGYEPFVSVFAAKLSLFQNLKTLIVAHSDLTDEDLIFLKALTDLEILDLSQTAVSAFGLDNLSSLARLCTLNLRGTFVNDLAVSKLVRLSSLKEVTVPAQSFSETASRQLGSVLSGCIVKRR